MEYLRIRNWDRWQTFRKDRATPPWIKLYRNLLTNPEWVQLSDAEKGQLTSIWLIAADKGGKISADPTYLRKMCLLDTAPNIELFKELGFLVSYSRQSGVKLTTESVNQEGGGVTTTNGKPDQAETETETEKPIEHPEDNAPNSRNNFEWLWNEYPEKKGKEKAWFKFKAQIKSPEDYEDICVALANYKNDVKRIRLNGQPDLNWQYGSTWFHQNWKDYVNYEPPEQSVKVVGGLPLPDNEPLGHNEFSDKIKKQLVFAEEMLNDDTYQGAPLGHDWLNLCVGNLVLEYSERFPKGPMMERFTEQFGILSTRVINENVE